MPVFHYAFSALVISPLLGALLAVMLPPRPGRHVGRVVTGLCALIVGFLWFAPPLQQGRSLLLVYPGGQAPCLGLDALNWAIVASTTLLCFAAMLWGREERPGPPLSPPLDAWVLVCMAFSHAVALVVVVPEAIAAVVATGLLPVLYVLLGLNHRRVRFLWLWPIVSVALSGALLFAASVLSNRADDLGAYLYQIPQIAREHGALATLVLLLSAYVGGALFPFAWPTSMGLAAGSRVAAFLMGSTALLPGLVLALRIYAVSHGRAMAVQGMYQDSVVVPLLALALITAAWHAMHLAFERDAERAIGRLAGLHGVYLFVALLCIGATRYTGYAALLLLLLARGLGFALVYFSLDWLRPELAQAPMFSRLKRAAESAPVAVFGLVIGLASVIGLPPFAGFAAKWALYRSALPLGHEWAQLLVVLYVVEAAIVLRWVLCGWRRPTPCVAHRRDLPGLKRWVVVGLVCLNAGIIVGPPLLAWLLQSS